MPAPTRYPRPAATPSRAPLRISASALLTVAIGLSCLALPAYASQADVCYGTPTPNGQVDKLTASAMLDCPLAGRHSLSQLAQAGWTVVSVQPVTVSYAVNPATQSPESANAWMVVVQTTKEAK